MYGLFVTIVVTTLVIINSKSTLSAIPLHITTENNYAVTLNLNIFHGLFVTIMVTTEKPHACILIDSLLGVRYIETDIDIHTQPA